MLGGVALEAKMEADPEAVLRFTYHQPNSKGRDAQNMPWMLKAYIDGIADAMKVDDNKFQVYYPPAFSDNIKGGLIVCDIETKMKVVEVPVIGTIE